MVRRDRSGSTSSTASNLSSPADSCCSSSSDSDANPTRVQWGPQRTPEKNWLRRVRKKDSREFVRRQSLGWDRSLRDRLESDDDASSAASSSSAAVDGSVGPAQSQRSSSGDDSEADFSGDEAESAVSIEPALLGNSVTTRRASRLSPALTISAPRDSDADSSDSDDEPALAPPAMDDDAELLELPPMASIVKTKPLDEGMPETGPAPTTPPRPAARRTMRSPILPPTPTLPASATSPPLPRTIHVKKEPAEILETIPLEAPVAASTPPASPSLLVAHSPSPVSSEPVGAPLEIQMANSEDPPASPQSDRMLGSPVLDHRRPEQLLDDTGATAFEPAARMFNAAGTAAPGIDPELPLVQEAEVEEEPSPDASLPNAVESSVTVEEAATELAAVEVGLPNNSAVTCYDSSVAAGRSPSPASDEYFVDAPSHPLSAVKVECESAGTSPETASAILEAELASPEPDDVSTVSAADVIVDEAQPPSSFESQGDLSVTSAQAVPDSEEASDPAATTLDATDAGSIVDVSPRAVQATATSELNGQDVAADVPKPQAVEPPGMVGSVACEPVVVEATVAVPAGLEIADGERASFAPPAEQPSAAEVVHENPIPSPEAPATEVPVHDGPLGDALATSPCPPGAVLAAVITDVTSTSATEVTPAIEPNASETAVILTSSNEAIGILDEPSAVFKETGSLAPPPASTAPLVPLDTCDTAVVDRQATIEELPPDVELLVETPCDGSDSVPPAPAAEAKLAGTVPDHIVPTKRSPPGATLSSTREAAVDLSPQAKPAPAAAPVSTPLRAAHIASSVILRATPICPPAIEAGQRSASSSRLVPARSDSPRSDSGSSALSTPPVDRKAVRLPPAEHAPIVRSIRSRIAKAAVVGPSAPAAAATCLARPTPPPAASSPVPQDVGPSRRLPVNQALRTPSVPSSVASPPARATRAARILPPSSRLKADVPLPPAASTVRRPLRPTVAAQPPAAASVAAEPVSTLSTAPKRKPPTPSSAGITPAARAPRSRKPLPTAAVVVDQMSDAKLQSLTLLNTRNNQAYFSPLEKVVVRKEGQNRPESPGPKVRKAGSGPLTKATLGKGRALFDAPGEEGDQWSDEERPPTPKRHVRGPGDLEDYESPMRTAPANSVLRGKAKVGAASPFDARSQQQQAAARYSVRWNRGLVLIRPRNSLALEPQHRAQPTGPKPAIKPVPPLDAFGNVEPAVPLAQVLKRSLVTYTKIIYDDDLPPPPPPAGAKKGRR